MFKTFENVVDVFSEPDFGATICKEAKAEDMNHRPGVHFIGIGGIGMSGLAKICLESGIPASGSDISDNQHTRALEKLGAKIFVGHQAKNIPEGTGKVVISTAISHQNEELKAAREMNIPIIHRSDLLAELFLDSKQSIAVAGCHGKTTTTSMISTMLIESGRDPTCVVGGTVESMGGNARFGRSGIFVAEADESDATFLKYFPSHAIITNLDNDHMDHYSSLDSIVKAFEVFASHINPNGTLYICHDDPIARNIAIPENLRVLSYGIDNPAQIMADSIELLPFGSTFNLTIGGVFQGSFELSVPGKHNVLNALPVIKFGLDLGLNHIEIRSALKKFKGAGRRFEVKGTFEGVTVIDDYGHHPSEIKATLAAAKNLNAKRILVVFQPHRYSRTNILCSEFGRCFEDCDKLFLTEIYAASEQPIQGVSSRLIIDHMPVSQRRKVKMVKSANEAIFQLCNSVEPGDVVFTIGAGNVTQIGPEFIYALKARAQKMADLAAKPAV